MTTLISDFDIPGVLRVGAGRGGMTSILIASGVARAEIYLHGGHVTQFQPTGERPVLWLSERSVFDPAKAIRGGVPVCFPWFGAKNGDASAPAHGFARLMDWRLISAEQVGDDVVVVLELAASAETRALWPAEFVARQTICIGRELTITFEVANLSTEAISFEAALHTYFAVGDVGMAKISGFGETEYIDALDGGAVKTQSAPAITFTGETDRVYLDVPAVCGLHDPAWARDLEVVTTGARDAVVWNPWSAKAQRMADFGDDEWTGMVCIETANVKGHAVRLAAGQTHTMTATIRIAAPRGA